jgi:hypothetical protein
VISILEMFIINFALVCGRILVSIDKYNFIDIRKIEGLLGHVFQSNENIYFTIHDK